MESPLKKIPNLTKSHSVNPITKGLLNKPIEFKRSKSIGHFGKGKAFKKYERKKFGEQFKPKNI